MLADRHSCLYTHTRTHAHTCARARARAHTSPNPQAQALQPPSPVQAGQPAPQVAPLLPPVPRQLLLRVAAAVVLQVRHHIQPRDKHPVRQEVEVEHRGDAELGGRRRQHRHHPDHARVRRLHHPLLRGHEQVALGVVVAARLPGGAAPQVEGVGEEGEGEAHAAELGELVHVVVDGLGGGVPGLVVLDVAVVLVVSWGLELQGRGLFRQEGRGSALSQLDTAAPTSPAEEQPGRPTKQTPTRSTGRAPRAAQELTPWCFRWLTRQPW